MPCEWLKCNVIDRNDGLNISVAFVDGQWIGDAGAVACNESAAGRGSWVNPGMEQSTAVYPCERHLAMLREYPEKNVRPYYRESGE